MQITIKNILDKEANSFNGLDKYFFTTQEYGDIEVYGYRKPGNEMRDNDTLTGTVTGDKRGALKFSPEKTGQFAQQGAPQGATQAPTNSGELIPAIQELTKAVQSLEITMKPKANTITDDDIRAAQDIFGGEIVNDL